MRKYLVAALLLAPCSSYAVLPYIFANQPSGNVPASYLDTDFSLVENGVVQPVISTGSANSYSVAPSIPWVGGYSNYGNNGLLVNFNIANTGPSSINVSGLGAANLVKNVAGVATALSIGDINTNVPYLIINDGTQFWVQNVQGSTSTPGGSTNNVQYNNAGALAGSSAFNFISNTGIISVTGVSASTASITTLAINGLGSRGIVASVNFDGNAGTTSTSSIRGQFNISTVSRTSTGIYGISFTTALPNSTYRPSCTVEGNAGSGIAVGTSIQINPSPTTTGFGLLVANTGSGAANDSGLISCNISD